MRALASAVVAAVSGVAPEAPSTEAGACAPTTAPGTNDGAEQEEHDRHARHNRCRDDEPLGMRAAPAASQRTPGNDASSRSANSAAGPSRHHASADSTPPRASSPARATAACARPPPTRRAAPRSPRSSSRSGNTEAPPRNDRAAAPRTARFEAARVLALDDRVERRRGARLRMLAIASSRPRAARAAAPLRLVAHDAAEPRPNFAGERNVAARSTPRGAVLHDLLAARRIADDRQRDRGHPGVGAQ